MKYGESLEGITGSVITEHMDNRISMYDYPMTSKPVRPDAVSPTAFVFGGTGGIGKEIVKELENRGYFVVVYSKSTGFDLTNRMEGFFVDMKCDIFIYAAGVGVFNEADIGDDDFKHGNLYDVVTLNFTQPMVLANRISARHYIFIGSNASYKGIKGHRTYCGTKHGLLGFARALRAEGKKVSVVSPGAVDTPFWSEGCGMCKPKSCLSPEDVARAVMSCISSEGCIEELVITP